MKKSILLIFVALCSMGMWAANPDAAYLTDNATPGGWSTDAAVNQMYKAGDGNYVWAGDLTAGELKFLAATDWIPSYGPTVGGTAMASGENALVVRNSYGEDDNKFAVSTAGNYLLHLNISDDAAPKLNVTAQSWESVHMFVVPEKLWSGWSSNYTLKVSVKRWNGADEATGNWDQYAFSKSDAVYDNKAVYFGDVYICYGGFAKMTFDAYDGETKVLDSYTFWPESTDAGYWMEKADFENKVFYGWNKDYITDFPFIHSVAGNRIWFDNSASQWEHVYVRIGRDALTGAGNYAATWPMTQLEGTDLWYVDSENWSNALVWTIVDFNDNNGDYSVYNIPAGANRLYFFNYSITEKVLYIADGDAAQGTDGIGVNYWACHNIPFFTRDGLTAGNYGTVCLPMGSQQFAGAEFYRVAGKELENSEPKDIVIESVNAIEGGVPYLFRATAPIMVLYNEGEYKDEPDNSQSNGLIGSYELADIANNENNYILHDNMLYRVNDSKVGAYRAYFDFSLMSEYDDSTPAAGVRRRMNIDRSQMPSAINAIEDGKAAHKILRDGQLIILHQDKQFNAQGTQIH